MNRKKLLILVALSAILIIYSCSKSGGDTNAPPSNPCAGITVNVTGSTTNVSGTGATNGAINVTATGGSGFTYSINSGAFQSSGSFTGLAAGTYTVTAKNANGCTGSANFTIGINLCTGVTITVNATATNSAPCGTASGTINATASGSTGFTYSINSTTFQASGNFTNVAAGNYTVTAKDANGCSATQSVIVGNDAAGPLFSAVKTLLQNNCVSCHNNAIQNGGMNWAVDCNIVANKDRIKARAVDNTPSAMPPTGALSSGDKAIITNWINAGGKYSD